MDLDDPFDLATTGIGPLLEGPPPSKARAFFFRERGQTEDAADVIRWWESRRLHYNIAVGSVGLFTLTVVKLLTFFWPTPGAEGPPLLVIPFYGLAANIMYTGGWIAELAILRPMFKRQAPVVGAALFRYGLAFAVGLTLLPNVIVGFGFVMSLLSKVIG